MVSRGCFRPTIELAKSMQKLLFKKNDDMPTPLKSMGIIGFSDIPQNGLAQLDFMLKF